MPRVEGDGDGREDCRAEHPQAQVVDLGAPFDVEESAQFCEQLDPVRLLVGEVGATTAVVTGDAQALAWIALAGLGLGLVPPTTIDTALGTVSGESSGVSSVVLQALHMVGGALGAAILGAILNATYRDQLEHAVTPALARPARDSAVAGVDAATAYHSQPLLDAVQSAFVSGLDRTLWFSAALMAAGGVLALAFRPRAREAQAVVAAEAAPPAAATG